MIIRGNPLAVGSPRSNYTEANEASVGFILNKPDELIQSIKATAEAALPKAGGTVTGALNVPAPTANSHAATKEYVDGRKVSTTASLLVSGWANKVQTVSVPGVTASNNVLITAAPDSFVAWGEAVVYCTAQGEGTLTFTCDEVPATSLTANILIMN